MRSLLLVPMIVSFLVIAHTTAPAAAQPVGTLYLDTNVAGDVQTDRGGVGASIGYYFGGKLGIELDIERHDHFFRDEDIADLVPVGIDLNSDAMLYMGNIVVPLHVQRAGIWRPYASAGAGAIRAIFDSVGADQYDAKQTNLTIHAGAGVMHALTRHVGLRADAHYFRALVDESAEGGYRKDYGFWRVSLGVTIGFPH